MKGYKYMIEQEFKSLLTKNEYLSLLEEIEWDDHWEQTNFYYSDDNGVLRERGVTLRIRVDKFGSRLEVKMPVNIKGGIHTKKELTYPMQEIPSHIDFCQYFSIKENFPYAELKGVLITTRYKKMFNENTILFLDKSSYLNTVDYEIEIEFEDQSSLNFLLKGLLKKYNFDSSKVINGKCKRFFERLKNF